MDQNLVLENELDFHGNRAMWNVDGIDYFSLEPIGFSRYGVSRCGKIYTEETGYVTKGTLTAEDRYRVHIKNDQNKKMSIYLSLLLVKIFLGPPPSKEHTVDHINRDRTDNRIVNLKWATKSEQALNRNKPNHKRGKYIVQIDRFTGFEIMTWLKATYAAEALGMKSKGNLAEACKNGEICYGYRWKYSRNSLPGEEWKQLISIKNQWPFYVSNLGRVITTTSKISYGSLNDKGYKVVKIDGKPFYVHRLVMLAFHGHDDKFVNHKDGNKRNNKLENLEYLTCLENNIHAIETGLRKITYNGHKSRPVLQMDSLGNILHEFPSAAEASRHVNVHQNNITAVCRGKNKTSAGFRWKYKF